MDGGDLLKACLVKETAWVFVERLNEVITDASAGMPKDFLWLSNFVTERVSAGDFDQLTRSLLTSVFTLTAEAWAEQIGAHEVRAGYRGNVDLDTAISDRQAKACAFLRIFRDDIRPYTVGTFLLTYTATSTEWSLQDRVSFNSLVIEPVVLQCVYKAHCVLREIPATLADILAGYSQEQLGVRFQAWKFSRASLIVVLNAMVKAYFIAGYCVFRRLEAVCKSERSYRLVKGVHKVS